MTATEPSSAYPASWSELYDLSDFDRRPWQAFYRDLAGPQVGAFLDLGCGTGTMTRDLAARLPAGSRVVGVDLSPAMIAIARAGAPGLDWRVGDIAAPPVEGRFDLVTVMFNTLQYLPDRGQLIGCFRAVADRLTAGGRLAFDIANPNPAWLAGVNRQPQSVERITDAAGRRLEVRERRGYDPARQVMDLACTLHDAETGADTGLQPLVLHYRQVFPDELLALLTEGGLKLDARYGDLDRSAFHAGARRQVCLCSRA